MKNNNTFTHALPNSKETRDGARACIHAMKKVRKLVQNPKDENYTCEELFRIRDAAGQIMLDGAGAKQLEAMRKEHVDDYNKFMSEEVES